MNKKIIGISLALGAGIMWGLEPIVAKLAYASNDTLSQIIISRSIFAAALTFIYSILKNRKNNKIFKINRTKFIALFAVSTINVLFADMLYYLAVASIPVANAVVIAHLQPILVLLLGYFLLKHEKVNSNDYFGVCLMIIAGIFVSTGTFQNLIQFHIGTRGDLLVFLAMTGWASTTIIIKKYLAEIDSSIVAFYRFFIATLVLLVYLAFNPVGIFSSWYQVLLGAIVGFGFIMFYEGLKLIKAVQASALELSAPFFGIGLSFLILRETITWFQGLGILSLFIGVYFLSRKE